MFERNKNEDSQASEDTGDNKSKNIFESRSSKKASGSGEVATIGRSIQINGDLRGEEDLRIEGDVSGTVELRGNALIIGKEGNINADVYARSIAVDGKTKGDLYATERVSVHVNAQVQGNIISPRVSIEEGAHFKGSIDMDPKAIDKAIEKAFGKSATETEKAPRAAAKATSQKPASPASTNLNPPAGNA